MKIQISESQLKRLMENKSNPFYILYHSSDSDMFDTYDHTKAAKGDRYFNPLGNGLYCSTNKDFSKGFGKNVYYYLLPKTSKIKVITQNSWVTKDYPGILSKVLRKHKVKYSTLDLNMKVMLNQLGNDAPITSLNELSYVLMEDLGLTGADDTIENVVDERNANYDAVWYRSTDYYLEADEVVIPPSKFRKDLFVKQLPEDINL